MNEQPEIQPNQEAKSVEVIKKIDFLYKLKGKAGEIYAKMYDFFDKLRKKYPEENMKEYFLYHKMIMSGVKEGEACLGNNRSLIEEMVEFVESLYIEYGGEEQK